MNIGEASRVSGVSAKMIRYYDKIGLIHPANRNDANYRKYDELELNELSFIKRARGLGFSIEEISQLLSLWRDRKRPSREVKAIVNRHVADLDKRIAEVTGMVDTLQQLADSCAGSDRPECPILADLTQGNASSGRRKSKPVRKPHRGR